MKYLKVFDTTSELERFYGVSGSFPLPTLGISYDTKTLVILSEGEENPFEFSSIKYTSATKLIEVESGSGLKLNAINPTADVHEYANQNGKIMSSNGNITGIGENAFNGTTAITVTIPKTVTSIGNNAFSNCSNLQYIIFTTSTVPSFGTTILANSDAMITVPAGSESSYRAALPEYADRINKTLQPNNEIWYTSVSGEIIEPANLTSVYPTAVYNGPTIISNTYENGKGIIKFASDITFVGTKYENDIITYGPLFMNSTDIFPLPFESDLTSISLPKSVTNISGIFDLTNEILIGPFMGNTDLNNFEFKNSNISLGNGTFALTGIETYTIPESITQVPDGFLGICPNLTSVTLHNLITSIGSSAFYGCSGLTSIAIPSSVTSIGDGAFYYCSGLTSIDIPDSVTSIGDYVFWCCSNLASIAIPNSVTSIGFGAFSGCSGLTSIAIPNSVTSIGSDAFYDCSSLTSVTVLTTTPPTLGSDAFYNTNNCPIYVPYDTVDTYKAASGWSNYTNRIQAIPD